MNIKLLLLVAVLPLAHSAKRPKILNTRPLYCRWHYTKVCDYNPGDIQMINFTITYEGATKLLLNGVFHLARDIIDLKQVIVIIRRCNDAAENINCEYFQTWRVGGKEACVMVHQDHMIWSSIVQAAHPKLVCPTKKGVYHLTNGTYDAGFIQQIFSGIPVEKHFWRVVMEVHDYELIGCLEAGVQFLRGKH